MNLIASLKHTHRHHEHIVFWRPDSKGYTPVVSDAGLYDVEESVRHLNDGINCIAVPAFALTALSLDTPLDHLGRQFYDIAGPVIENNRATWNALMFASLAAGRHPGVKPKPEVFRGTRRARVAAPKAEVAA